MRSRRLGFVIFGLLVFTAVSHQTADAQQPVKIRRRDLLKLFKQVNAERARTTLRWQSERIVR